MAAGTYNQDNNIGTHSERSVASLRAETPPSPPAALSQDQGNAEPTLCSGSSAQRFLASHSASGAESGSFPISAPSLDAAQITLRSRRQSLELRRIAPLARVAKARRIRQEERGNQLFNVFPDGTSAPADPNYDPYHGSFLIAAQQATGLVKGKTLPADAVTVLLTQVVVHQAPKERSCRIPRLNVILALMGCADEHGIAPEVNLIVKRASKTERELARAILSLKLDGGDMKSRARHEAGVEVRVLRTTKGGK